MRWLLDTSTVSSAFRAGGDDPLLARLDVESARVALAVPVWHELRYGCALLPPSRRREALERFLEDVVAPRWPVLPYDRRAADWHGVERARLSAAGRTPPFVDGQIAAIARVNGLALVTANVRDFEGFEGLEVEDWTRA